MWCAFGGFLLYFLLAYAFLTIVTLCNKCVQDLFITRSALTRSSVATSSIHMHHTPTCMFGASDLVSCMNSKAPFVLE